MTILNTLFMLMFYFHPSTPLPLKRREIIQIGHFKARDNVVGTGLS